MLKKRINIFCDYYKFDEQINDEERISCINRRGTLFQTRKGGDRDWLRQVVMMSQIIFPMVNLNIRIYYQIIFITKRYNIV